MFCVNKMGIRTHMCKGHMYNASDNNDTRRTIHDGIGSMALMPNEPKIYILIHGCHITYRQLEITMGEMIFSN